MWEAGGQGSYSPPLLIFGGGGGGANPLTFWAHIYNLLTDSARSKTTASRKKVVMILYLSVFGTESAFSFLFSRKFVVLGVKETY